MSEPTVPVFFYGSYMNADVLEEAGLSPRRFEAATLQGFRLEIRPLANLVRSEADCVHGLLTPATHAELERLYTHAREVLGGSYLPHPVLVEARAGKLQPALCYIAPASPPRPAASDYVDRVLRAARQHGFPSWYLEHIESFRP